MPFPQSEVDVAKAEARRAIDESGYGTWVSDEVVNDLVVRVLNAIDDYRQSKLHGK